MIWPRGGHTTLITLHESEGGTVGLMPPGESRWVAPNVPAELGSLAGDEDGEWSQVEVGGDFAGSSLSGFDIDQCVLRSATFTGVDLAGARFQDTVVAGCEFSGAVLTRAACTRVEFRECRMSGVSFAGAQLHDVRLTGCKLDGANFRMAKGERVWMQGCDLSSADFYSAHLGAARIIDCDLAGAEFSKADMRGARLTGSRLHDVRGADSLRETTIDSGQLVPLALGLFAALGIHVDDDRPERAAGSGT